MRLSRSCRRVALFDSPVEVTRSYAVEKRGKSTEFRQFSVPPFDYEVSFREAPGNSYVVSFALTDIHAEGSELAAILSRLMGRDVPVAKADLWKRQFNPVGILNTGNASQVLGSVVRIIRDFVREENPSCLALNAIEPSRKDLYRRMVRSIARGARVDETQYGFQICLPSGESEKKTAMRLTPLSRWVTAVFDSPVSYQQVENPFDSGATDYEFQSGLFSYTVTFHRDRDGVYEVDFRIDPRSVTRDRVKMTLERSRGEALDVDSDEVWGLFDRMKIDPWSVLGSGQSYQVFAHVIQILREFVRKNHLDCIRFSASPESRSDLYRAMIRRFVPGAKVESSRYKNTTDFTVCGLGANS